MTVAVRPVGSQDSFYFDPAPVSQVVVEGDDVLLRCDVSSRQFITFYWTLDDRTLANTSRRYQDASDLRILSVNRTLDAGSFRCVAVNVSTGIAVRSAQAQLTVYCKSPHSRVLGEFLSRGSKASHIFFSMHDSFSFLTGQVSFPCNILLRTQLQRVRLDYCCRPNLCSPENNW